MAEGGVWNETKWAEDRNFDLVDHFSSTTTRFQHEKTAFLFYISLFVFLPSQGSVSICLITLAPIVSSSQYGAITAQPYLTRSPHTICQLRITHDP
jgi:hypothetical protein